jgi:malic enzyme
MMILVKADAYDTVYTYDFTETDNTIALSSDMSSVKLSLVDTGNDVRVMLGKRKIVLDYAEVQELQVLLRLNDKKTNQTFKIYKTIEEQV